MRPYKIKRGNTYEFTVEITKNGDEYKLKPNENAVFTLKRDYDDPSFLIQKKLRVEC